VADNGPGIPEDQQSAISDYGVKDDTSNGTGLGLYLVDVFVDQFGGTVTIEDNNPRGSVFVVRLPKDEGRDEDN
jgi:signal transduction histidine kinase